MTEVLMIKCDGCNQEAPEPQTKDWLEIKLFLRRAPGSIDVLHFDSYACMGRYAQRKTQEEE